MACLLEPTKDDDPLQMQPATKMHAATIATTGSDDVDDTTNSMICIVCWEPTTPTNGEANDNHDDDNYKKHRRTMLPCHHGACHDCISNWIQRCEVNGQDEATCPHCRQVIGDPTMVQILGRPYQRQPAMTEQVAAAAAVDDFTQTWLDDHDAQECPNCGMYQVRDDEDNQDDVHATACLCGYIYCWDCQEGAASAECGCDHFEYYDYMVDDVLRMEDASDYPVATEEDLQDLAAFMERRKAVIFGEEEEDEEDEEQDDDVDVDENNNHDSTPTAPETNYSKQEVVEEKEDVVLVALFDEHKEMEMAQEAEEFTSELE